ncbi:C-type lectin domain family 17, member A isoform X3 [Pelodiscus sinensis]|uniref:C-type lectin domain family 17, member A isoform X3 n=1 Tax=Pelodiscus sinensis TaxID=13735 RepID=UPI003F6A83FA
MAHLSEYGNWMGRSQAKGKKAAAERRGAPPASDEDDYENVSLEDGGCSKPPPLPRDKKVKAAAPGRKDRGGAAGPVPALSRPPETGLELSSTAVAAAFQPPEGDLRQSKPIFRRDCSGSSPLITYILLGICFLMCGVFLTLALMKRPDLQQELEELSFHLPQMTTNVSQQLAEARQDREKIRAEVMVLQGSVDFQRLSLSEQLAAVKKFHREIQAQITALQKTVDSVCGHCPDPWVWFQRTCYYFSESTKPWLEAQQFCVDRGAHLVIINTKEEQAFLLKNRVVPRVYWLGLSDQQVEKEWVWVDNTRLTLSFWSSGEPNDSNNEDCGTMTPDGRWNDLSCLTTDYWICEKAWFC